MFNEGDVLYKQKQKQARNRPKDFFTHKTVTKKQNCPPEQFADERNLKMQKTNKKIIKKKKKNSNHINKSRRKGKKQAVNAL